MFKPERKIIELTKDNVGDFKVVANRRAIRESKVEELVSELRAGEPLLQPIHVSKRKEGLYIIDGNHRLEALKKVLEDIESIKVPLYVYSNLSFEEETELYDTLAKIVNQTMNDTIQLHFHEVDFFKRIENSFPVKVNIYSSRDAVLYAWLLRLSVAIDSDTPKAVARKNLIKIANGITKDFYYELKDIFSRYQLTFGTPESGNPYYKFGSMWIVASIVYRNQGIVGKDKIWTMIKQKLYGYRDLLDAGRYSGKEVLADARTHCVEFLNRGYKGSPLI